MTRMVTTAVAWTVMVILLAGCAAPLGGQIGSQIGSAIIAPSASAEPPTVSVFDQVGSMIVVEQPTVQIVEPTAAAQATWIAEKSQEMDEMLKVTPTILPACSEEKVQLGGNRTADIVVNEPATLWYIGPMEIPPLFTYPVKFVGQENTYEGVHMYHYITYNTMKDLAQRSGEPYAFEPGTYNISDPYVQDVEIKVLICPPM